MATAQNQSFIKFSFTFILLIFLTANFSLNAQINLSSEDTSPETILKTQDKFFLTPSELDFVANHQKLIIAIDPNSEPYEYYDKKKNSFYGANISILNELFKKIGITPSYLITDSYKASKFLISRGLADIILGDTDSISQSNVVEFSKKIYSTPCIIVSLTKHKPFEGERITIGSYSENVKSQILKIYPKDKYFIEEFDTITKSLECLKNGHADYAIVSSISLLNYHDLLEFSLFPMNIEYEQKIGVSKSISKEFIPILNRAIDCLTNEELNLLLYRGSQYENNYKTSRETVQKSVSNTEKILFSVMILTAILLLAALLIYLILNRKLIFSNSASKTKLLPYNDFEKKAHKILLKSKPYEYIILSMNINNFSFIKESKGIAKGNQILAELANSLKKECVKGELICHCYADNFVFLFKNPGFIWLIEDRVYKMIQISPKIKAMLPEQFELSFTTSVFYIGNTSMPIENMINKANLAQKMKKNEYTTHRVIEYTKDMENENEWNRSITLSMNKAIENNEFEVYYQPKFRFSDEKIIGAEALVRWNNPEKGFLLPGKFIPLFEHNKFIEKLDKYVFTKVCEFLDDWNTSGKDKTCPMPITISFNLSRCHLYNSNLISELKTLYQKHNIGKNHIEVELTESIMFDDQKKLVKVMNELKNAGFTVSVDDFGSGYSSLNLLKDMPADVIKLDKEFLSNVPVNNKGSIIISSVIELAKKMKITTVAEGVETKVQSDLLKESGCDIAQGFYYAKPMPRSDFKTLLLKNYAEERYSDSKD